MLSANRIQSNQTIEMPFEYVWQIYFLQMMVDNYKPIFAGMAVTGAGAMLVSTILC